MTAISHAAVRLDGGEVVTFEAACTNQQIDPGAVVARFGTWVVTQYGLECIATYYPIPAHRVHSGAAGEYGWEEHMRGKADWVKYDEFIAALRFARVHHAKYGA